MQRMTIQHPGRRTGFTILELLVVIGVIAILASLGFVMVRRFGTTSRDAQTQATLKKVDAALQDRLQSLARFYENADRRAGDPPPRVSIPVYVDDPQKQYYPAPIDQNLSDRQVWTANGANNLPSRAFIELRARKKYKRKHFPMSFAEADLDGDGNSDITGLPAGSFPPGHDNKPDQDTESAEVLYYFLTQGAKFGSEEVAVVDFIDREIADTDGDGLLEIVDGWGNPLRFYRWPTRLIRPQPAPDEDQPVTDLSNATINVNRAAIFLLGNVPDVQILRNDPQDPLGTNTAPPAAFEQSFHTKQTWHAPLVLSAGPDGKFGLLSPTKDTANYGHLAQPDNDPTKPTDEYLQDNLTNLKLRVGGN